MNLYIMHGMVFVDIGNNYLLAIGTEAELWETKKETIADAIREALARAQYREMPEKGISIH